MNLLESEIGISLWKFSHPTSRKYYSMSNKGAGVRFKFE